MDHRTKMADEMAAALRTLDRAGHYSTPQNLYRLYPLSSDRVQPDQAELDALWKQVESARTLLHRTGEQKPDPERIKSARAMLEKLQQGYAELDGDLQSRARRLGNTLLGSSYDFTKIQSTPMKVDGNPAIFLTASSRGEARNGEHIGFLAFEFDRKLVSLVLYSDKPIEVGEGEKLAAGIRVGVEPPAQSRKKTKKTTPVPRRIPDSLRLGLFVMLAASLPAAFGAMSGYGPSKGPGLERAASTGAGAFFFTGIAMLLGISILFILALTGISEAPTSGANLMAGVGLLIFLGFYGTAAAITWLLTCNLASLGAKAGARHGRIAAALGAGVLAGLGALLVPGLLGWLT